MNPSAEQVQSIRKQVRGQMPDVIANLRAKSRDHVTDAPSREAGYTIHNATGDEAVVRIYDEIWFLGVNAMDLAAELDNITAPNIRVEINSPGGDVWDGIAIYNALRTHPAKVTTRVDGIAASIASVIAQAGDHRIMLGGSQMMIHNAWGMTIGDNRDHTDMAGVLDHQDQVIAGIYASRSGKSTDEFRALMDAETWMTADEAVEHGLADEVVEPSKPQDRIGESGPELLRGPSLNDKIASAVSAVDEAVSSAEQVSAVRAEAGKTLSVVNRESLSGLRDAIGRVDGLLSEGGAPVMDAELAEKKLALSKRDNDWRASLPVNLLV